MSETTNVISSETVDYHQKGEEPVVVEVEAELDVLKASSSWRPPTPPRQPSRPSTLSSKLSSMARRAVLNIGGVDTSVALSAADELLLSEKEHQPSTHQNLYDLRRKAGLIRTRSNPLEIKSISSEDYHSRRLRNGYRNIVGETVAQGSPPRPILFSKKRRADASAVEDGVEDIESQQVTNQGLAAHEVQITTSYTSLPEDDDFSSLATNQIRKECYAFYDVDEVCHNVSFPSPLMDIKIMLAGKQPPSAVKSGEKLFYDENLTSLPLRKHHIPNHRRSNSARYFRDLVTNNKRGVDYYCGSLENFVNWTDQTKVAEPCALTPLPSGVVDVDVSTNSTLYELNRHTGRVQIHLPKDDVRLVMDPNLEAGILCVVVTEDETKFQLYHTNSSVGGAAKASHPHKYRLLDTNDEESPDEAKKVPPLTYILTVDDDLYKRVLNELAERWSQPFGLYFCTHETDETSRVSPWFAGMILSVILLVMFIITLVIQDD